MSVAQRVVLVLSTIIVLPVCGLFALKSSTFAFVRFSKFDHALSSGRTYSVIPAVVHILFVAVSSSAVFVNPAAVIRYVALFVPSLTVNVSPVAGVKVIVAGTNWLIVPPIVYVNPFDLVTFIAVA